MMKPAFFLIVIPIVMCLSLPALESNSSRKDAEHLATALDHITVLEFGEPVMQAAVGSAAFTVEWRADKVLIKPLKPGAATDLFVWTASRRFTYELDPPGEAKNMNYALDNPVSVTKPVPDPDARMAEIADVVLTRALLGAERIDSTAIKNRKGRIVVRIETVFQSATGLYVRYAISNLTSQPYRVLQPSVFQVSPIQARVSLRSLEGTQLNGGMLHVIGEGERIPRPVAKTEVKKTELGPGETTEGVIVLRQEFTHPTIVEITFPNDGERYVAATFVF